MSFSAVDFLRGVVAAAVAADGGGSFDRLGVDDQRDRMRAAALAGTDPAPELVTDVSDDPGPVPSPEKPVDRLPGREIRRQSPPLRAVVDDVADAVDDLTPRPLLGVPAGLGPAGRSLLSPPVPSIRSRFVYGRSVTSCVSGTSGRPTTKLSRSAQATPSGSCPVICDRKRVEFPSGGQGHGLWVRGALKDDLPRLARQVSQRQHGIAAGCNSVTE